MRPKPIVGGRVFQGPNLVPEIPHGFSQKNALRPHLPGDFVINNTNTELTPPTIAPVLTYYNDFESYVVALYWTASNKAGSSGFGYKVEYRYNSGAWTLIENTTELYSAYDGFPNNGNYDFRVTPFNDAGEGPSSNTVSLVLPGESSDQSYLLIEDGSDRLLEDGSRLILG